MWFNSLRFIFPVVITVSVLLVVFMSYTVSRNTVQRDIVTVVSENVRNRLSFMQGAIGLYAQSENGVDYRQLISSIVSEPDFIKLLVIDNKGRVVSSDTVKDIGMLWLEILEPLDQGLVERTLEQYGTEVTVDPNRHYAEGYSAVCASSGRLRQRDCGFILYRVDLEYHHDRMLYSLYREFIYSLIGISLFGLFLIVFIHRFVTRRSKVLVDGMKRFAAGDRDVRMGVQGKDEIGELSSGVNHLFGEIKSDEEKILKNEKQLDAIFNTVLDSIITINEKGIIQSCNPATVRLFGYEKSELLGKNIKILMPQEYGVKHDQYLENYINTGVARIIGKERDVEGRHKNGNIFPIELSISETMIDGKHLFTGVVRDVSERKHLESALVKSNQLLFQSNLKLKESARTDVLTGVANRRWFDNVLDEEIKRAARHQGPISLLLADVDFFKLYNDTYGHQTGDDCLRRIGAILGDVFKRSGELPARYGGEEFAIILPGIDLPLAKERAELLLQLVCELKIEHKSSKVADIVTMSIGVVCMVPERDRPDAKVLIQHADEALYSAKAQGRNCVVVYGEGDERWEMP
jgi:diguanylate cyclase (GGDEF)-like protein/PAS domain S-box-containing protein